MPFIVEPITCVENHNHWLIERTTDVQPLVAKQLIDYLSHSYVSSHLGFLIRCPEDNVEQFADKSAADL